MEAIISSIGYAGGVVIDKIVLSYYLVPVRRFIPWLFIWLAIITGFAAIIFRSRLNLDQLLGTENLILFALMIVVAFTWNIFYYEGIQRESVHEFELVMLFSPLATIILAELFLPTERSLMSFIVGIIASLALLVAKFERHHFKISNYWKQLFLATFLIAFESIIIKKLLLVYDPTFLYLFRTIILAVAFLIAYRPKLLQLSKKAFILTIISAFFGVLQMVLKFYGFINIGVVETTMFLILGPILVYLLSAAIFKEKIKLRAAISSLIVVGCIVYISFFE